MKPQNLGKDRPVQIKKIRQKSSVKKHIQPFKIKDIDFESVRDLEMPNKKTGIMSGFFGDDCLFFFLGFDYVKNKTYDL